MTAFSYMASGYKKKNFKEPALLGKSLENAFPKLEKKAVSAIGWTAHYAMGLAWFILFGKAEKVNNSSPLKTRLLFGIFSGICAVIFWRSLLRYHPNPPVTSNREFYYQLIPAHIIFCLSITKSGTANVPDPNTHSQAS